MDVNNRSYMDILTDMFPNKRITEIEEIVDIIHQNMNSPFEYMLEEMINLLAVSGDSALNITGQDEGAVGYGNNHDNNDSGTPTDGNLDMWLLAFPDICPKFLLKFCNEHDETDEILVELSKGTYPKKAVIPNDVFRQLMEMLPNADPDYLKEKAQVLACEPSNELNNFVDNAIKNNDYPSIQEYLKKKKQQDEHSIYTKNFSVEKYLAVIPNPLEYYSNSNYVSALRSGECNDEDVSYALTVLCNHFIYLREKDIKTVFAKFNNDIIKSFDALLRFRKYFKEPRFKVDLKQCTNLHLLQEIAYLLNKQAIRHFIKMKDYNYRIAREQAEKHNLLETCQCCFFDGLIPEECYFCKKNCVFCKECVIKGSEFVIGRGELTFPCLASCESEFSLSTLRMVLDEKIFEPLANRIQNEEVRKANIEGLEVCPHCEFCMIPNAGDKIFKCQNIACMKETCRQCQHDAHVPLRCNEIEYDEDIQKRTYIENKMSEALLRKCWKCSKMFYKESGCNKMTCQCGAKMCYICGAAVSDYSHFQNTSNNNRCPLYIDDLNKFHADRILRSAAQAKAELGVEELKIDPTKGLHEYFESMKNAL